jgi:hypothetical protein
LRRPKQLSLPGAGSLDVLYQPLPHVKHGPGEQEEDADDRQIGLHRRRLRCRGYAGQPRIFRLLNRIATLKLKQRVIGCAPHKFAQRRTGPYSANGRLAYFCRNWQLR